MDNWGFHPLRVHMYVPCYKHIPCYEHMCLFVPHPLPHLQPLPLYRVLDVHLVFLVSGEGSEELQKPHTLQGQPFLSKEEISP